MNNTHRVGRWTLVIGICLITASLFLPFASPVSAQQEDPQLQVPDTIEGAKEGVLNIGDKIMEALPEVVAGIWDNQVIPLWKALWKWVQTEIWEERLGPATWELGDRGKELLGQEVEKRRPILKEELQKEKQELKEDLEQAGKDTGKSLWERFKALFEKEKEGEEGS